MSDICDVCSTGSLANVDLDYLYDEEAEEEMEETHVPKFSVEPQTFDVMIGEEVRLPCSIDKGKLHQAAIGHPVNKE